MARASGDNELKETFAAVEKRYGAQGHRVVRNGRSVPQPYRLSTGCFMLDFALLGGIPSGRISMVLGSKHSGKSMISCKIIGNVQKQFPDQRAVYIDVEKTFDPVWAEKLGCDVDNLYVVEAESGEMAVDIADAVVGSKETSLLVLDSLAALVPVKEIDSSVEDQHMALQARLIGRALRKLQAGILKERLRGHEVSVLLINQWRTNIGVMFGDPRTAPGGKAAEHFPSLIWTMKNKEKTGKDSNDIEIVEENEHAFTISKWKCNNGPRTGEFRLVRTNRPEESLSEGDIDDSKTILAYAKKFGAWSGGGTNQRLEFADFNKRFSKVQDAVVFLNENRRIHKALSQWVIREQAKSLGMPKEFLDRFCTGTQGGAPRRRRIKV